MQYTFNRYWDLFNNELELVILITYNKIYNVNFNTIVFYSPIYLVSFNFNV